MPDYRLRDGWLSVAGDYKPGDPPPKGYLDWHEWAAVQEEAGLRQRTCPRCSRWSYPQELTDVSGWSRPVCLECAGEIQVVRETEGRR